MFAVMHDWTASEVQMEDPVYKWKHHLLFIPTAHTVTMRIVEVRAHSAKGSRAGVTLVCTRRSPSLVFVI